MTQRHNAGMTQDVVVREYRPEYLDSVLALVKELESELAEKFSGVQIMSGESDYRNRYLKPGNKYQTYVALVGGGVVGYLMGYPSLGAPEVDAMYDTLPDSSVGMPPEFFLHITFVSRPYRNRGISKKLHREMIEFAKRQGYREIYACIAKWNLPEINVISAMKFDMKDLGYRYRFSLKLDES